MLNNIKFKILCYFLDLKVVGCMDEVNIATLEDTEKIVIKKKHIYLFIKRVFDIICGLIGLIFLIPITLFVKISYMITGDFHSIFFSQKRIGKNGKEFKLYKFRTMVPNADEILKKQILKVIFKT